MAKTEEQRIAEALAALKSPGKLSRKSAASGRPVDSYFESAVHQRLALHSVTKEDWLDPKGNLNLYELSESAFDPSPNGDRPFRCFEKIYAELSGRTWQVFRPSGREDCWPSRQIFETINREFREFSGRGPVNLVNFPQSGTEPRLRSCLMTMQGIKPKRDYPVMTVSKFLHFYNPKLFPIYDNEVIWGKVLDGRFQNDFRAFCEREGTPYADIRREDTVDLLLCYMRWASSLLAVAHPRFMNVFVEWLDQQPGTWLPVRKGVDAATLYATAFEFTVIGAVSAP